MDIRNTKRIFSSQKRTASSFKTAFAAIGVLSILGHAIYKNHQEFVQSQSILIKSLGLPPDKCRLNIENADSMSVVCNHEPLFSIDGEFVIAEKPLPNLGIYETGRVSISSNPSLQNFKQEGGRILQRKLHL